MERKRLTFYTNMPTPYQIDFFNELKKYFELRVVYFTDREKDRQWNLETGNSGYQSIVLKNSWIARLLQKKIVSFHFSWAIIPLLLKDNAEVVITNGGYFTPNVILSLIISKLKRKKVFFWTEPLFPGNNKILFYLKYLLLFPVRSCTTALLAIGKNAIDCYRRYGYVKEIFNIPYNIDISLFNEERLSKEKYGSLQSKYKPNQEIILLTSCNLTHRKGVDVIISAFSKLPANLKARLLIIGDGPERVQLEKMALVSGNQIDFLGFIEKEDIPYYFSLADIFAFASRYDGWALVINEAIAADLAIICSNQVGAASDKLINDYNALIFDPGDVSALYDAMLKLINDKGSRSRLVENGQNLKKEISSAYNAERVYGLCNNVK